MWELVQQIRGLTANTVQDVIEITDFGLISTVF